MSNRLNRLIVLGGSAGGLDAVTEIVATLDADLPAAVCVVLHLSDGPATSIVSKLDRTGPLPATLAPDSEPLEAGRIYLAPPDQHLLIQNNNFCLSRGPRVNRARPAIDLAFRSAAVACGAQTIGVVLSGMLDDGAAGLHAIARCGGTTIVQDPADALYDEMPASALACVEADHTVPASAIGDLLNQLAQTRALPQPPIPEDILLENRFDMNSTDDLAEMDQLGSQVPLGCPDCGGPLWEIKTEGPTRYRCHIGHSLTARTLLARQDEEIEHTLWMALRTLEEKARMQERLIRREQESGRTMLLASYQSRADETRAHADRLRQLLFELGAAHDVSRTAS